MKNLMLLSVLGISLMATPSAQAAPVVVGIGIGVAPVYVGPAPVCPYGYYPFYPYACAPFGYYGPEWFSGGVFIGAGPYYHGSANFYGHVDHALDYRKGYRGPTPARGEAPRAQRAEFHGTAMHDSRGREAPANRR